MKKYWSTLLMLSCLIPAYSQMMTNGPEEESEETAYLRAKANIYAGKPDKALATLDSVYKKNRSNYTIAYELSKLYLAKNNMGEALRYAQTAAENSKTNKYTQDYLAKLYLKNEEPAKAASVYKDMTLAWPDNDAYYYELVDCYMKQEKYAEALVVFQDLEAKFGYNEENHLSQFELLAKLGKTEEAYALLQKMTSSDQASIRVWRIKAKYEEKMGKSEASKLTYKKVLALDANDTEANLALLSYENNPTQSNEYLRVLLPIITNNQLNIDLKVKELLPYVTDLANGKGADLGASLLEVGNKLILTHPNEAKAHAIYGDILTHTDKLEKSIEEYEKTIALNGRVFAVWEQLMVNLWQVEAYDKLLERSMKAIGFYPNNASGYFYAGVANAYLNKPKEALSIMEEGVVVASQNKQAMAQFEIGKAIALLMEKKYDEADKFIQKSIATSGDKNYLSYEILGDIYVAKQQLPKAAEAYEKSKQMGNKSPLLTKKIVKLGTTK